MKIDDSSLFFTCSLLELIGRTTRQKRNAVVNTLGKKVIGHIYASAGVLHCEPIAKTADYYIDFCHIPAGDFDNVASCNYTVPSYWDIGKVYARLIEDVTGGDVIDTLFQVYNSVVSDMISNFNSDFFYQSRDYIKEYFIANGDPIEGSCKKPAIRFSGFTDLPAGRQALGNWYTYVLECDDGSLYKGKTNNIDRRIEEHLSGYGAEHTKKHKPIRLVLLEAFETEKEAVAREQYLKSGIGRNWLKKHIIENSHRQNGNVPEIRFAGFTDAWEQRRLGDIVTIIMGQSPDGRTYSDTPSTYILVQGNADLQDGWVMPRIWTTHATKKASAGDLIMSVRAPAGAMGKTAYNVILGRGVAGIKGNEFIYQCLVKMDADGYWKKLSCGSTFESLNSEHIFNAEIHIPSKQEQERIGDYFSRLDRLITLHQRKYDKLSKIKKSMLEKLFPKNGSNVPEIRFAGFTDAWEQRKLGEITTSYSGGTPPVGIKAYYGGGIPFIRSAEINRATTELCITLKGLENSAAKLVESGCILYALYGATSGEVGRAKLKGAINQAILAIVPQMDYDAEYLTQWLKKSKDEIVDTYLQGGQGNLSGAIVKELFLSIPSYPEQEKIGSFFRSLDDLITLHQRKLEKLKKVKQSCLEKMFV